MLLPVPVAGRFFALLTVVAFVLLAASVVLLLRRRVPAWAADAALPAAFGVAVVATLGSLYYSLGAGFPPCDLCWYQRIAVYPQVVVLGVALLRRDRSVHLTALPLASVGAALSVWHLAVERVPALSGACEASNPCAIRWVEEFGFLTLPGMALVASATIGVLTLVARSGSVHATRS